MLKDFLKIWPLSRVENMTLEEYSSVGDTESFCNWLERKAIILGRIGGTPSNKFGIWEMKNVNAGTSLDFYNDGNYKWYKKYGNTADEAFVAIRKLVVEIIKNASNAHFDKIDSIDYFSLAKWKIAFVYSQKLLMPIYKKDTIRKIAKNFEHPNYTTAPISELHTFIVGQKPKEIDLFDFSGNQYGIALKEFEKNYYIIGSKYGNSDGRNSFDISPEMFKQNVIATGFFWDYDLSHLYSKGKESIDRWIDKNIDVTTVTNFKNAKRTLSFFLGIKPGDLIAVKSHGQYGDLTIVAYAEVVERNGKVYHFDFDEENSLGHLINVEFLEVGLDVKTNLSYGKTIHHIIPGNIKGHFEKIFGSYAVIEESLKDEIVIDEDDFELSEDRINDKQTESQQRTVSYTTTVSRTHNKIQGAFARYLKEEFPNDIVQTEASFIDVVRQNDTALYYYEVKPYNSAYNCIRVGIGQLLDYYHTNKNSKKTIHLRIVGNAEIKDSDQDFINFLKNSLNISFDYMYFPI